MSCPNCNKKFLEEWSYCTYCGQELASKNYRSMIINYLHAIQIKGNHFRTIWDLLVRPRKFFDRYFSGITKGYINPIELFITTIGLEMLLLSFIGQIFYYGGGIQFLRADNLFFYILSIVSPLLISILFYLFFRKQYNFVKTLYFTIFSISLLKLFYLLTFFLLFFFLHSTEKFEFLLQRTMEISGIIFLFLFPRMVLAFYKGKIAILILLTLLVIIIVSVLVQFGVADFFYDLIY